jgi:hypothetical protein
MTGAVGSFDTVGEAGGHTTETALDAARALASSGRVRDAIALLTETNRRARSARLEIALVELRHAGFDRVADPVPPRRATAEAGHLETVDGLPQVAPAQLGPDALEQGLARYGCLFVPGLLAPKQVRRLVEGIDRTFDEFDRWQAKPRAIRDDEARAWFTPFRPVEPYAGRELGGRTFTRSTGGIWTVESPRVLFEVIETFEAVGLGALVAGYLGELPALSAAKCNLRRTPAHIPGGWHQDGSFLGRDIATLDVWIALSTCGRDAPGLDIVPLRIDELLETGRDKVVVPHQTVLDAIAPLDVEIVSPEYHAGDVLIFDHMFLHRTAIAPGMTRERHALETWFFAPSRYPDGQIPLIY